MQCDYLVEFVTAAREGSLSKAALELSLSQSALSRHLKALESNLGAKLLERSPDGVELTETGRYVYNRAGDIIDAMEDIAFYTSEHQDANVIVIGGLTVFPTHMRRIAEACNALPEKLNARVLSPGSFSDSEITELVGNRKIDAYLTMASDARLDYLDDTYQTVELFRSPLVAVMEGTNPLASRTVLNPTDLDGQLLLHAQSDFDGERVNWADTKDILRGMGIDYRSKTCTLVDEASLLADFKTGILLFPEDYSGVGMLRQSGKSIIPVHNVTKTIIAVYRKDDRPAAVLSSLQLP